MSLDEKQELEGFVIVNYKGEEDDLMIVKYSEKLERPSVLL